MWGGRAVRRDGRGDFEHGCGEAAIRASVEQILSVRCRTDTSRGEYPWKSSFGSVLYRLRHMGAEEGTSELARYYVVDALRIWEPRITVKGALVNFEENQTPGSPPGQILRIGVLYAILGRRRAADIRQTVFLS